MTELYYSEFTAAHVEEEGFVAGVPGEPQRGVASKLPNSYDQIRNAVNALLTAENDLADLGESRSKVLNHIRKALRELGEAREVLFEATIGRL